MFKNLPTEIEFSIYDFLILPLDICKIKCISKYHNKIVNNINFIIQKNNLLNRAYMCIEDKECYNNELAKIWEDYSKINWPLINSSEKNYTPLWKVGDYVDVLDKIQVWGSAKIIAYEIVTYTNPINKIQTDRKYLVEFLGWGKNFNEWVTPEKITFFGSKTINPNNKYKSLSGSHKRWVLYNKLDEWSMQILTIKSSNSNEKTIQVVGFSDNDLLLDTLTPLNISNKVRSVTNATVYLSFKSRRFFEDRRLIY